MNTRVRNIVLVVILLAFIGAVGWYQYNQSLPLTAEECDSVMLAAGSTKEMGYRSMSDLEADLRECGYSGREIAMWHAADFAKDSSVGYMPTDPKGSVIQKLHLFYVYGEVEDIPSLFTITEGVKCQRDQIISLDFVVEIETDGLKNGGPDTWNLKCAGETN